MTFAAPEFFASKLFFFKVLEPSVTHLDYDAVMSSQAELQGIFGPENNWPQSTMTLESSSASLQVHLDEFINKTAFAFCVLNSEENKCLGSIYIDPSRSKNYDCEIYYWLRTDSQHLMPEFLAILTEWLDTSWPFEHIAFPGRKIPWTKWHQLLP